jgi:hypothetical protein
LYIFEIPYCSKSTIIFKEGVDFGILQGVIDCLVFGVEAKSKNLVDLVDHLGGCSGLRGSLGIFSGWLSKNLTCLPGVHGAVTSTKRVALSILQGV